MSQKEKNKLVGDIPLKTMGTYLKDRTNFFFIWADKILMKYPEEFCKSFLELLFRTKLKDELNEDEFKFHLLTGIGKKSGKEVISEPAEVKDLPQTIQVLSDIFGRNKLSIEQTKGKTNAFQKNATAAKVYYTIKDESNPILYLEIRYKGSYTANPQFQCVATPDFKAMFKDKK